MEVRFRPARADELQKAQELVVLSINDLAMRHGFGPIATLRSPELQAFSLRDDPAGLWIAEMGGELVGFAFSWISGGLWFLSELFVAPDRQGLGVGDALLLRTLEHARIAGAGHRALITFAFNTASQGLYARYGLYPRLPLHMVSVPREALKAKLPAEQALLHTPMDGGAADGEIVESVDRITLGVSRGKHHQFLLRGADTRGFLLHRAGQCVGYAYLDASGHIGPMAVIASDARRAAFLTMLQLAAGGEGATVSAFIPGVNEAALGLAIACGMRMVLPMVLVSASDFGDWARYLPRNPGFM
jgi:GNAT superfamily N-acetyltransferase